MKLTRDMVEKAMKEAVQHMPIIVPQKGRTTWEIVANAASIDVFCDELERLGVKVDESMTDEEVKKLIGSV